jgi:hypothetical protein
MPDGEPLNFTLSVCALLGNHFLGKWINVKDKKWTLKRPDLTTYDLFLFGWSSEEVYFSNRRTMDEQEQRIWDTSADIPLHFLRKSIGSEFSRLQECCKILEPLLKFDTKW